MKRPINRLANLGLGILFITLCACQSKVSEYDVLIRNGILYDGSGTDGVQKDVGIVDDEIVAIGDLSSATSKQVIDAKGEAVVPGFIDIHAHLNTIKKLPDCESHIRQGVTTALGGPDGTSPWPLKEYLEELTEEGIGMNVGYTTGHNTIRKNILKLENRAPTADELQQMLDQVKQAMEEGAFGLSTGLKYLPGTFAKVDEVTALSKVAAQYGGFYTSHLREEGLQLLEGVAEAIQIGKEASIPVVLTHHKVVGAPMWGSSVKTIQMVQDARDRGQDVMIDQYPYTASYTGIGILIPSWSRSGGNKKFIERTNDPILYDSVMKQVMFNLINDRGGNDLTRVQFAIVKWDTTLEGKTLYDWAVREGVEPTIKNGAKLVIEAQRRGGVSCVFHAMSEEDVIMIMQYPFTAIASDGRLTRPGIGHPHPRWYGTFTRVLEKYVREDKVLSLQEAIRKMTSLPASRMKLTDRGYIKKGYKADIVVFDPETVKSNATFEKPHQYPTGISYVMINGQLAVDKGEFKKIRSGRVLYSQSKSKTQ